MGSAGLHGGASAALLVHAFERCSPQPGLRLARITFELMRPVPVGRLTVTAEVTRPGRRVMLLEGSIRDGNGAEVARARALRVGPSELGEPPAVRPPFAGPERGRPNDFGDEDGPMFANAAIEIRFVEGAFRRLGPATAWFRLRGPIVAGEPPSPFELLAAAGDFGNGIATTLSWEEHMFINPDLTLYLEREPRRRVGRAAVGDAGRARQRRDRREPPVGSRGPGRPRDAGAGRRPPLSGAT